MAAPLTSRSSLMAMAPSAAPTCPPSPLSTPSLSPGEASTCPRARSGCVLFALTLPTSWGPRGRVEPHARDVGCPWALVSTPHLQAPLQRLTVPLRLWRVVLGKGMGLKGGSPC